MAWARASWDWLAFTVMAGGAAAVIAHFGSGWTFFYDEWGVINYRRGGGLSAFLAPLNGHLVAVPVAIYRALFATVGLGSYKPYQWTMIVVHLGLCALLYAYAKRRLPRPLALLCVAPVLLLGQAWEVLFWMMNLGFVIPLIAFLGILLLSDRDARWSAPARGGLLAVAVASSGLGVAVAAGAFTDSGLKRRWRDLPWLAVPSIAYGVWFLFYRPHANTPAALRHIAGASPHGDVGQLGVSGANLRSVPGYLVHIAESGASGLLGARATPSVALLVGGLVIAGLLTTRRLTPGFIAIASAAMVFWLLTALARAEVHQPFASRYIYPGAIFLAMMVIEAWSGFTWSRLGSVRGRRAAFALLVGAVAMIVTSGALRLRTIGDGASRSFARQEIALARLQCPAHPLAPTYDPDPSGLVVTAGTYHAAIQDLGSPVPKPILAAVCGRSR